MKIKQYQKGGRTQLIVTPSGNRLEDPNAAYMNELITYNEKHPGALFLKNDDDTIKARKFVMDYNPKLYKQWYNALSPEIKRQIPNQRLTKEILQDNYMTQFYKNREEGSRTALGVIGKSVLTGLSAPVLLGPLATAGTAAELGIAAGQLVGTTAGATVGSYGGRKLDNYLEKKYNINLSDGLLGMGPGELIGGFVGGGLGWKGGNWAGNRAATDIIQPYQLSRGLNNIVKTTTLPQETAYSQIPKETVTRLFQQNPELAKIGTPELYGEYYNTIYPASKVKIPYAHGTNSDLSGGLANSTKQINTGAPETIGLNDMYFNRQPEASLQYINGVNTPAGTWNQTRYWPLKEITGKPYNTVGWQEAPITVRQQIPNRAGQFSRVKNADGTFSGHGKLLEEYKAKLGASDMSDAEFLNELGVKPGENFNEWVARNKGKFEKIYQEGNYPSKGLYFAKVDAQNPLTIEGGSTYYGERGIWNRMKADNNDVLLHNNAANEFNSDVLVVKNVSPEKVTILGSTPDQEGFRQFVGGRYKIQTPSTFKPGTLDVTTVPRPTKPITAAEKVGIPRGDRSRLSLDQKEAIEDALWYNTTGKYKKWFFYDKNADKFRWGTPNSKTSSEVPAVKALLDNGASANHNRVTLSTSSGNFTVWPGRNAAYTSNFPIPESLGWSPGETSLSLDGSHSMSTILTSPKVDYITSFFETAPNEEILSKLPNTIDKGIMKNFWKQNEEMIRPGTYLSGDSGFPPLGQEAMRAIDKKEGMSSAIAGILHPESRVSLVRRQGLSPDSYSAIIRQGTRNNKALRWGEGFTKWNPSAVKNQRIYEAWQQMKKGEISPEQYKEIFDAWIVPQGGRPAIIRRGVENKNIVDVIMPHPYILYKKQGGTLNMRIKKYQQGSSFRDISYLPSEAESYSIRPLTKDSNQIDPSIGTVYGEVSARETEENQPAPAVIQSVDLSTRKTGTNDTAKKETSTSYTTVAVKSSEGRSYHYKEDERQKFKTDLYNTYVRVLKARGMNPAFAKYLVAQDALESGWGHSYAGKWNFGNITKGSSWKGSTTKGRDHDGFGRPITQEFRNYDSMEDYANDKINLLNNSNYRAFSGTPEEFYTRVGAGGYVGKDNPAHIQNYVNTLNRMVSKIGLAQQGMKFAQPAFEYIPSEDGSYQQRPNIPITGYQKQFALPESNMSRSASEPIDTTPAPTAVKPIDLTKPEEPTQTQPAQTQATQPSTSQGNLSISVGNGKKGVITFKHKGINVGNMQDVLDKLSEAGISVRVTSGLRKPGEAGKAGSRSHHVRGNAVDITPGEGETFETIRQKIKANKALQQWFRNRGIGIIDETVAATKKKTGATGDHFHIGPDKWARREFETLFTKLGGKIPPVLLYSTKNPRK